MTDISALNVPRAADRLVALRERADTIARPPVEGVREVNCHVHTIYSFSPYSPTAAATRAVEAGLAA
ncbi:MAG TPA: PHP domain-containing protein, partial [Spirochaetia bacterium]